MRVTLVLTPWEGAVEVPMEKAAALLRRFGDSLIVNGKPIPHERYVIEASDDQPWLLLRVEGAPIGAFTPEEFTDGSDPENGYYLLPVTGLQVQTPDGAVHSWVEETLDPERATLPPDPYLWESGT